VTEFTIRSNRRADQLRLWVLAPGRRWRARIDFGDLTAEGRVDARDGRDVLGLAAFLEDLAERWRGWDGDRAWESLGLVLAARHDRSGHVTVDATLSADYASPDDRWQVRASLSVDAGTLPRLAADARRLDQRPS
jgi:uncharacterized protein DUF6228